MMKILQQVLFIFALVVFYTPSLAADSVRFFESIQDLPLMNGLSERAEDTVVFDKPGGRVIESIAEIHGVSNESVQQYYAAALPQFGWQSPGQNRFVRGNESLELIFENHGDLDVMRVLIRPR